MDYHKLKTTLINNTPTTSLWIDGRRSAQDGKGSARAGTNTCVFRWRWNTLTWEAWPVASSVTAEKHVGEAALPDQSRQDASPPYYSPLVFFVIILIALPRYPALLAPGSPSFSLACRGLFHLDFHAHPGMDE